MEIFISTLEIGFCVSHLRVQRKCAFSHTLICEDFALFPGTEILTVQAADNDDPKTDNVRIFYRLVGQIPESPRALFRVDRDSGVISVQADNLEGAAPQYTLTITAEDAKGDQRYCMAMWFCGVRERAEGLLPQR